MAVATPKRRRAVCRFCFAWRNWLLSCLREGYFADAGAAGMAVASRAMAMRIPICLKCTVSFPRDDPADSGRACVRRAVGA